MRPHRRDGTAAERALTADTSTWWAILCVVSTVNVLAWLLSAASLTRRRTVLHLDAWPAIRAGKGEFIAVNCAALPETMRKAEFFG